MSRKNNFGMRTLSSFVPELTEKSLSKHGGSLALVIQNWQEIVGPEYSRYALPMALKFAGPTQHNGTLHIQVDGPAAVELQYQLPQIIQRVNGFLGFQAVAQVRMVQAPLPQSPRPVILNASKPLDTAAHNELKKETELLPDGDLKSVLNDLGKWVS
jgi:hypothetical protein